MLWIKEDQIRFKIDSADVVLNFPMALDELPIPRWKKIFRILKEGRWGEAMETLRDYLPIWEDAWKMSYEEAKQYKWPSGDKKTAYVKAQKMRKAFDEICGGD